MHFTGMDKVLKKLTKSYKRELRHLFQCIILIPRKCPHKTPFQHTVPPPGPPPGPPAPTAMEEGVDNLLVLDAF